MGGDGKDLVSFGSGEGGGALGEEEVRVDGRRADDVDEQHGARKGRHCGVEVRAALEREIDAEPRGALRGERVQYSFSVTQGG